METQSIEKIHKTNSLFSKTFHTSFCCVLDLQMIFLGRTQIYFIESLLCLGVSGETVITAAFQAVVLGSIPS